MSKLTFPLLLTLLVIWLIGATWWFNKKYVHINAYKDGACTVPFMLTDGNFKTQSEKTLMFELSDWEPTIPLQTLASLKSVALYIANSERKTLTLTGWYGLNEVNNSDFSNNGLARAEAIKNELIGYGAPEQLIITDSKEYEKIELTCGKIHGGVDFNFSETNTITENTSKTQPLDKPKKEEKKPKEEDINFSPDKKFMVFYDENTFKPELTEEQKKYFERLAQYLKDNPRDRLLLMGHTDNTGSKDKHFNFGKYRARKLRDAILDFGVEKRRIKTDSEGSSKPLGSNKTAEGRYQNRRVEISVIQR